MNKRVLSCIQPSGSLHLGNYLGAIKNWVALQAKYECFYGIVDLHALTIQGHEKALKERSLELFAEILSCGINPEKSTLFLQSRVTAHAELTWILSCLSSFGALNKMTQFKDKAKMVLEKDEKSFISVGLFTYPILQAADILLYDPDYVPIGKDQQQHLELTRNIALRFNHLYGNTFRLPEALFTSVAKLMSLSDPKQKMSKSSGDKHFLGLFEPEAVIEKKIKTAVTDMGNETSGQMSAGIANLFLILESIQENDQESKYFIKQWERGTLKYKELKEAILVNMLSFSKKMKAQKAGFLKDKYQLNQLIASMSLKAEAVAAKKLQTIKQKIGIV